MVNIAHFVKQNKTKTKTIISFNYFLKKPDSKFHTGIQKILEKLGVQLKNSASLK